MGRSSISGIASREPGAVFFGQLLKAAQHLIVALEKWQGHWRRARAARRDLAQETARRCAACSPTNQ